MNKANLFPDMSSPPAKSFSKTPSKFLPRISNFGPQTGSILLLPNDLCTFSRRHHAPTEKLLQNTLTTNKSSLNLMQIRSHSRVRVSSLDSNRSSSKQNSKDFDLADYSKDEILEIAVGILQKSGDLRTPNDVKTLTKCTEHVKFFQSLDANTHEQCCKYMTYEKLGPNEVLFEIGSYGTKFYIILKGSVQILANLMSTVQEASPSGRTREKKELVLTEVKVSKAGESFGELALLEHKPRAATIKTMEETHFGVLEKQYYDKILKEKELKKFYDEVNFYQSIELFSSWAAVAMKYLVYHTEKKSFIRGQRIYKQNELAEHFFIIKSGEFQMICKVPLEESGGTSKDHFKKSKKTMKLELSILSAGSFFGEEELLNESARKSSVYCHSLTGELIIIAKKEFQRRIISDDKTREYLLEYNKMKQNWKNHRLTEMKHLQRTNSLFLNQTNQKTLTNQENALNQSIDRLPHKKITRKASILIESSIKQPKKRASILKLELEKALKSEKKQEITNKRNNLSVNLPQLPQNNAVYHYNSMVSSQTPYFLLTNERKQTNSSFFASYSLENSIKTPNLQRSTMKNETPHVLQPEEREEPSENPQKTLEFSEFVPLKSLKISSPKLKIKKKPAESEGFSENLLKNMEKAELLQEKSHITSRWSLEKQIKEAFQPREMLKLEAYKKYEEIKENLHYYNDVKGKKKLEDLNKFVMPHRLKLMIKEVQKRNFVKTKSYNSEIVENPYYFKSSKPKKREKNENIEGKSLEEKKKLEKKTEKCKKDLKFLPLKYSVEKIINTNAQQHYFALSRTQHQRGNSLQNKSNRTFIHNKNNNFE